MSAMSSLLVFLLYFSRHACHALFTGAVHEDTTKESQCLTSKKNETLNNLARVSTDVGSSSQDTDNKFAENKANIRSNEAVDHRAKDDRLVRVSAKADSRGSISWRLLHHKKRGDGDGQEPEFNLDYLPPRTHPPAHN